MLYLAEREGHIHRNPTDRLGELVRRVDRRIATESKAVEAWTRAEASTLLAVAFYRASLCWQATLKT